MINIEQYLENLKQLRVRTNGRCNTPKYRKLDINPSNVKVLLTFNDEMSIKNRAVNTRATHIFALTKLFEFIGKKTLKQITRDDILNFFNKLKEKGLKETSINSINSRISEFLFWYNKGKYPECIEGLKPKRNHLIKLPKDIPDEEDIKKLISVANTTRDKAIISVLYESACRSDEFLKMKIGDLQFDTFGCKVMVSGKTGDRMLRLVNSVPVLKLWLNEHPYKDDTSSPLWVDTYNKRSWNFGKPLHHTGLWKLLQRMKKRAKIEKKIHPHLLRHRRLTELAKRVPESILRRVAGWTPNSNMVEVYVHYNNEAVDEVLLSKVYEKTTMKNGIEDKMKPVICNRCNTENPIEANYCHTCYYPLNEKAFSDFEIVKNAIAQILGEAWKQPNPKEALPSIVEKFKQNSK